MTIAPQNFTNSSNIATVEARTHVAGWVKIGVPLKRRTGIGPVIDAGRSSEADGFCRMADLAVVHRNRKLIVVGGRIVGRTQIVVVVSVTGKTKVGSKSVIETGVGLNSLALGIGEQ